MEHGNGVVFAEDPLAVDANKLGSLDILESGLVSGMHLVCCAIFLDTSDIGTMTELIGCQSKSI